MATHGNTALSNTALSNILFTFFRCFGNDNELSEYGNVNTFLRKQSKQYQPISHLFTQSFALSCMPVAWLWSDGPDCGRWAIASWDRMPSRTSWKSAWRGVGGDGSAALALCASKDAWILDTSGISAILEAGIHWWLIALDVRQHQITSEMQRNNDAFKKKLEDRWPNRQTQTSSFAFSSSWCTLYLFRTRMNGND